MDGRRWLRPDGDEEWAAVPLGVRVAAVVGALVVVVAIGGVLGPLPAFISLVPLVGVAVFAAYRFGQPSQDQ